MAVGLWPLFGWDLNTLEVFLSKVRAEQLEETWPRSCQRRLGAPLPGAVTFPGFLADAVQDPSPGRVSAVLGAGQGGPGLRPPGAHSGSRVLWPVIRSAVTSIGFVLKCAVMFIK